MERKVHSQKEIEDRWSLDEKRYDECRVKHFLLLKHYRERDAKLRAQAPR